MFFGEKIAMRTYLPKPPNGADYKPIYMKNIYKTSFIENAKGIYDSLKKTE